MDTEIQSTTFDAIPHRISEPSLKTDPQLDRKCCPLNQHHLLTLIDQILVLCSDVSNGDVLSGCWSLVGAAGRVSFKLHAVDTVLQSRENNWLRLHAENPSATVSY